MIKKILILLTAFLLLTQNIYASYSRNEAVNYKDKDLIVNLLESKVFDLKSVEKNQNSEIYKIVNKKNDKITNITKTVNGKLTEYKIVEGDKVDILKLFNDKIYLNGKELKIDYNPLRAHRHYLTKKCPYGKKSDYTYLKEDNGKKSIYLEQAIKNITEASFVYIIGLSLGLSQLQSFGLTIGAEIYDSILLKNPNSRAFGCWDREYYHKDRVNSGGKIYILHDIKFYYDEECTSYIDRDYCYEVFDW